MKRVQPKALDRSGRERGFSLVEVVIAILLTAIVTTCIMAFILSVRRDAPRADRKMIAAQASKQLMDQLKNYVTASFVAGQGPGPLGGWNLPGDVVGAVSNACENQLSKGPNAPCSGVKKCKIKGGVDGTAFALNPDCIHSGTAWLSTNMQIASIGMTMCYCVADVSGGPAHPTIVPPSPPDVPSTFTPQIWVAVDWLENPI